jgi:hypothetical protein
MRNSRNKLGRRQFVEHVSKGLLAAGGALSVGQVNRNEAAEPLEPSDSKAKTMPTVVLGRTDLRVSRISLGTNPPTSRSVLAYCAEQGVTYMDSAMGYANGRAEAGLGEMLKELGLDRRKFCLSTKSYERDPSKWPSLVAESVKRLQTDHVELFFVHDLGIHQRQDSDQDSTWINKREVVEGAKALKKSGLVRHFGFSVHHRRPEHTFGLLYESAKSEVVDVIMVQYNFRDEKNEPLREAIAAARKAQIGIIACKPVGGNQPIPNNLKTYLSDGFNRWQAAIRWLANNPLVDVVCANMLTVEQAKENIAAIKAPPLRADDLQMLRMYALATANLSCGQCGTCLKVCPQQLNIPRILRARMYHANYGLPELGQETYASIPTAERADRCLCDGACEKVCPNGVTIRKHLAHAAEMFGASV